MTRAHFFWTGPLSQWQPCQFELDGHHYTSAEQAMMHRKALLFDDSAIAAQIITAKDPGKQKALGRQVRNFDPNVWDNAKVGIVTRISLAKFGQNKGLRRKLFQTGDAQLAEASPLDSIWGIGLDAQTARVTPPDQWPGQNLLGKILTKVRDDLKRRHPDECVTTP